MEKRLVGVKEAAEYLDISTNTLYTWVSQRRIPHIKVGRLVKFDLNKLDQYIELNTIDENDDWPFKASNN